MSLTLTLGVIALQLGTGYLNMKRSCKLQKEVAEQQRMFEEESAQKGIRNARKEMERLFSLQRDLERQMQNDRIINLRNSLYSNLDLIAYTESLENWPLLVPPFVMKNESLPYLTDDSLKELPLSISMQVILTNCLDRQFNVKIYPELEECLNEYLCRYWNVGSKHSITFYKGGWKDSSKDSAQFVDNLKDRLSSVPTLVISPVITKEDGFFFSVSCWGISNEQEIKDNSMFIPKGLKFNYQPNYNYSNEDKEIVFKELLPSLAALISYFADLYYWLYYGITPILPTLLKSELNSLNEEQKDDIYKQYEVILNQSISDLSFASLHPERLVELARILPLDVQIEQIVLNICDKAWPLKDKKYETIDEIFNIPFSYKDVAFLNSIKGIFLNHSEDIESIIKNIRHGHITTPILSNNEKYHRTGYFDTPTDDSNKDLNNNPKYHF